LRFSSSSQFGSYTGHMRRCNKGGQAIAAALETLEYRLLMAGQVFQVTTGADATTPPAGSLRAAIIAANAAPGSTISFSQLPANTPIKLAADLTPITAANTTLDGTTGPGGRVEIDGTATLPTPLPSNFDALVIQGQTV
jgi:CSLREA domain-containing protein